MKIPNSIFEFNYLYNILLFDYILYYFFSYPMELHMVFSNTDYDNDSSPYTKNDALVVLASFFEASDEDNPVYTEIVETLKQINMPDQSANLPVGFTIRSMLPESTELYFTYKGSLTTPPCLEVVTWIDFKLPILLSHNQVINID